MSALGRIDGVVSAAGAIVKLARSGGDLIEIAVRVETLREQLLAARREVLDLREENARLVERAADLARARDQLDQLALATLATGTHVYVARGPVEGEPAVQGPLEGQGNRADPPPPYFCAHCFGHGRASMLQPTKNRLEQQCSSCKTVLQIVKPDPPTNPVVRVRSRRDELRRIL